MHNTMKKPMVQKQRLNKMQGASLESAVQSLLVETV